MNKSFFLETTKMVEPKLYMDGYLQSYHSFCGLPPQTLLNTWINGNINKNLIVRNHIPVLVEHKQCWNNRVSDTDSDEPVVIMYKVFIKTWQVKLFHCPLTFLLVYKCSTMFFKLNISVRMLYKSLFIMASLMFFDLITFL